MSTAPQKRTLSASSQFAEYVSSPRYSRRTSAASAYMRAANSASAESAFNSTPIDNTVHRAADAASAAARMNARYDSHHSSRRIGSEKESAPRQEPSSR